MGKEKQLLTFVGLGNPGKKYAMTRHNIGYMAVMDFASRHGWIFKDQPHFEALAAGGEIGNVKVHLLLPTTYMNESGRAVRRYLDYFKMDPGQLVVVVDDVNLPFGAMQLKERGSSGGHNGLKSLELHLGTQDYPRLRLGVGAKKEGQSLADHVLSPFNAEEMNALGQFVDKGVNVLKRIIYEKLPLIMNEVNKKITLEDLHLSEGQEKNNESREKQSL